MLELLVEWYTEPAIRQGEVDRAVGLDHDIVRPIELASEEAARNRSNAAVEFLPGDAPGLGLAGDEPALNMTTIKNSCIIYQQVTSLRPAVSRCLVTASPSRRTKVSCVDSVAFRARLPL